MFRAHLRGCQIVIRMIKDNVTISARAGGMEQSDIVLKRRIIFAEGREIVGIKKSIVMVRNASRTRAERAPVVRHLGAVLPLRGDSNPLAQKRVPPKFAHDLILTSCVPEERRYRLPASSLSPQRARRI